MTPNSSVTSNSRRVPNTSAEPGSIVSTRIVTVTPNPSLDRTIELAGELQRGAVQRATRSTAEPGGKGVNVSRVVVASGGDTIAVLPGDELDPVLLGLATRGIPTAALPIGAPLRSNVTVTEPTGTTTKLNEPGPSLAGRLDDLAALVADAAGATATGPAARWVVLAGSLPPGCPTTPSRSSSAPSGSATATTSGSRSTRRACRSPPCCSRASGSTS